MPPGRRPFPGYVKEMPSPPSGPLRRSRANAFAESMPHIVWTASSTGDLTYLNCRWRSFTGGAIEDGLGAGWEAYVHPDDIDALRESWRRAVSTRDAFDAEYRLRASDGGYRWVLSAATAIKRKSGVVTKWLGTTIDIHAQHRRRMALLNVDAIGKSLASTRTIDQAVNEAVRSISRSLCAWSAIYRRNARGKLDLVAVEHYDNQKTRFVAEYIRESQFSFQTSLEDSIALGRSAFVPTLSIQAVRDTDVRDEVRFAQIVEEIDICSMMCAPLIADGSPWGVLQLVSSSSGRTLSTEDLPVVDMLSERVISAIQSASRHETQLRESQTLRFLCDATAQLSAASGVDDVLAVCARMCVPVVCDIAAIGLTDAESGAIRFYTWHGSDRAQSLALADLIGTVAQGAPVADDGQPIRAASDLSPDAWPYLRETGSGDLLRGLGMRSFVYQALLREGDVIGAFVLFSRQHVGLGARWDVHAIEELSQALTGAIHRARVFERERHIAASYQRASLPERMPVIPGFEFEAFFRVGADSSQVGGDWYDAIRVPDGRIVVSVGDVGGKGLKAAVIMSALRNVIRGVALVAPNPVTIINALDRIVRLDYPDLFISAFVSVIDPVTATIISVSAGHPSAVVLEPGGNLRELADVDVPIGLRDRRQPDLEVYRLDGESSFFFYTDGLVESNRDIVESLDRLHALLRERRIGPGITAYVCHELLSGGVQDDVALLAIYRSTVPDALGPLIVHWSFDTSDAAGAREVRAALVGLLQGRNLSIAGAYAVEAVFSELLANAFCYAPGLLKIALDLTAQAPVLHVLDGGTGFEFRAPIIPDAFAERGRGFIIVGALTAEFSVEARVGAIGSHARAVFRSDPLRFTPAYATAGQIGVSLSDVAAAPMSC